MQTLEEHDLHVLGTLELVSQCLHAPGFPQSSQEAVTSARGPSELSPLVIGTSHRAVATNPHQSTRPLSISHRPGDCKLNSKRPKMLLSLTQQIPLPASTALLFSEARRTFSLMVSVRKRINRNIQQTPRTHRPPKFKKVTVAQGKSADACLELQYSEG